MYINKNDFDIIIKDEKDFNELSKIADYSSNLTKVISIKRSKLSELRQKFPYLYNKYFKDSLYLENKIDLEEVEINSKPLAIYKNGNIYLENASTEILCFLEVWTDVKPIVKWSSLGRFFDCVKQDLIELNEELKDIFSPINKNTLVTDLLSSKMKVRKHREKVNWSFAKEYPNTPINELELDKFPIIKNPSLILPNMLITSINEENNEYELLSIDKGIKYTAKFYSMKPLLKRTLLVGRELNFMVSKVIGTEEKGYYINEPLIIPFGFKSRYSIYAKPSRNIPTANFNSLRSEYLFRKDLK